MNLDFKWFEFSELGVDTLYDILELRDRVFVVEQSCAYLEADGFDRDALHLAARDGGGRLVGYIRLLLPGVRFAEPSLGRVVVAREARGEGLGRALMRDGLRECAERFPGRPVRIAAQAQLRGFYEGLGFTVLGAPYDEDGIMHIDMICGGE